MCLCLVRGLYNVFVLCQMVVQCVCVVVRGLFNVFMSCQRVVQCVCVVSEGQSRKDKEDELKGVMKRLEQRYQALQVVPVIGKFGNNKVCFVH